MNAVTRFSVAWIVVWAFMHIITAFSVPWISVNTPSWIVSVVYIPLGLSLLIAVALLRASNSKARNIGKIILIVNAVIQVWGSINTFTGQAMLNLPFRNIEIFQAMMSFNEGLSAVFMLYLILDEIT
jgi:uncharacterized phage infection (PIP) family protein YhgE